MKPTFFQLPEAKRQRVLGAAINEFATRDYDAASLDHIIQAAGISKGGLYEYISGKEDLYLHCMEMVWTELYAWIRSDFARRGADLPTDILERFWTSSSAAIELYLERPELLGFIVRLSRLPKDGLAQKAEAVFSRHFLSLLDGLDRASIACDQERLLDLIKWLLAKTRKDVFLALAAGTPRDEIRTAYLKEWAFFRTILAKGIYQA